MRAHSPNIVSTPADLRIDGAWLWDSLTQLARIDATDKAGLCGLALTELDREARDQFIAWAKEIGCTVRVDAIGDIFAWRAGLRDDLPPVMAGSHIDVQTTGGRFEGNCGVLAGLEVLRTLAEANVQTIAPLDVAVWTNEEGSRFVPVMMGSGVYTLERALAQCDRDGVSVRNARAAIGHAGGHRKPHAVGAYFEAHIEQGPLLEAHDKVIGVVQGALDHAPHGRGTVGCVEVHLNSHNVIPGCVKCSVDLRATDDASLTAMDHASRAACKDGISHNEIEDERADHPEAGCNALLQAMVNAASKSGSVRS
ncbi:amidase, hydantoinase/carbamoylase family [Burkholderia sp. H160]|nr:amidase, hydantoinase/carbamoylase family [Burkholderia sp. H160]